MRQNSQKPFTANAAASGAVRGSGAPRAAANSAACTAKNNVYPCLLYTSGVAAALGAWFMQGVIYFGSAGGTPPTAAKQMCIRDRFVGFQSPGTLGRALIEGADEVRLFGETVQVNAQIRQMCIRDRSPPAQQ